MLPCPSDATARLAAVKTRLRRIPDDSRNRLINWGYASADAAVRSYVEPALPAPALVEPQRIEAKQATRALAKKQEARRLDAAPEPPPAAVAAPAPTEALSRVAGAAAAPAAENAAKEEATISPISGKVMTSEGMQVLDSASAPKAKLTSWRDTSRETKIRILKEELARGAEPGEVARVAREAGLNEFADSIEKKQQH